jgi:hypothetical protein
MVKSTLESGPLGVDNGPQFEARTVVFGFERTKKQTWRERMNSRIESVGDNYKEREKLERYLLGGELFNRAYVQRYRGQEPNLHKSTVWSQGVEFGILVFACEWHTQKRQGFSLLKPKDFLTLTVDLVPIAMIMSPGSFADGRVTGPGDIPVLQCTIAQTAVYSENIDPDAYLDVDIRRSPRQREDLFPS